MLDNDVHDTLLPMWLYSDKWWEQRAADAIMKGWFTLIHGRNDREVYLIKMWLSTPKRYDETVDFEGHDSVILHHFCRGDDDEAMHNHPFDFTTSIIAGSYDEYLPPDNWDPTSLLGPPYDQNIVFRPTGTTLYHKFGELHSVGRVAPGTFTLVTTGPKKGSWGFHPPGKPFVPWREYLASLRKT